MSDSSIDRKQLVTLARELERLMARARKISAQLDEVHARIRTNRKLLRDLTTPDVAELYGPPDEPVDVERAERAPRAPGDA